MRKALMNIVSKKVQRLKMSRITVYMFKTHTSLIAKYNMFTRPTFTTLNQAIQEVVYISALFKEQD